MAALGGQQWTVEGLPWLAPPWTLRRESRRKGMCFLRRKGVGASGVGRLGRPDLQGGNNVLQARKMGKSRGAGHFPQPKKRRAGEWKAAAADPVESLGPPGLPDHSPGPRAPLQMDLWAYSFHRPCTLTTKWGRWPLASTSQSFSHLGHPWKSRGVGDTLPGPSPEPASAVHPCSNAAGTPPPAGRNSLSPQPLLKGPLHEGPFCLPRSRKDPTLGPTAGHPDAAGHEARAECQSRDQRPRAEFPLIPEPARLPTACPWQGCWEAAPDPSPARAQLRHHTHPALVPTRPVDPPVTVPTFCKGVKFRSVPHPPDYTPPPQAPGQEGPSVGWASEHPPIRGTW